MFKFERIFRNGIANVVIMLCVACVFGAAVLNTDYSGAQGNPQGAIYRGESTSKVSLMINVYWGTEYLDSMLKTLDENKVSTTFFVGGSWAANNEEMLKKIHFMGHEIGNHGYFHKDHSKLNAERNREEIEVTHKLINAILGVEMNLFAPPSGAFSSVTIREAEKLGYKTIMWSADTIDWRDKNPDLIFKRATAKIKGGDLILMHPTEATAQVLDKIIKEIAAKGLTVSTVTQSLAA